MTRLDQITLFPSRRAQVTHHRGAEHDQHAQAEYGPHEYVGAEYPGFHKFLLSDHGNRRGPVYLLRGGGAFGQVGRAGVIVVVYAPADLVEVEPLVAGQADGHADQGADTVGGE